MGVPAPGGGVPARGGSGPGGSGLVPGGVPGGDPSGTATATGGTHPTGMHSCSSVVSKPNFPVQERNFWLNFRSFLGNSK